MMTRALLAALFTLFTWSGCSVDIGDGSQLAGQSCFQESDCADGLTCSERVCVPFYGSRPNDSGNNANNNPDMFPDGGPRPDMGPIDSGPDVRPPCLPGERRCASTSVVEHCLIDSIIREEVCPDNAVCEGGDCVPVGPDCRDNDGDGYGAGCPRGADCNDGDPRINPGAPERCSNRSDDNCNGQINEGCDPNGCCVGGCGPEAFCTAECACQPFDPGICEYQNQPCAFEGDFENGFYCVAFSPNDEPRCWGICDINAANPDATCPDPNSVCAFDAGDGQAGICMSACGTGPSGMNNSCGEPGLGCLNLDIDLGDGICVPINADNGRGQMCDSDYFFDCDEGLICLQGGGNRGRCREACRPFFYSGMGTDCDQGHCLAFSEDLGVCFNDNNSREGETCAPAQSACNADAVGCYDAGDGQECLRICRLDAGDSDCFGANQSCTSFDPQQTELGICF